MSDKAFYEKLRMKTRAQDALRRKQGQADLKKLDDQNRMAGIIEYRDSLTSDKLQRLEKIYNDPERRNIRTQIKQDIRMEKNKLYNNSPRRQKEIEDKQRKNTERILNRPKKAFVPWSAERLAKKEAQLERRAQNRDEIYLQLSSARNKSSFQRILRGEPLEPGIDMGPSHEEVDAVHRKTIPEDFY